MTSIVWLRRDLRIADNPALLAAAERGPVLPVYIHAPDEEAPWQPGAASRWWLHRSLTALQQRLAALGLPLVILAGDSLVCLQQLIADSSATAVFWNRRYESACIARDTRVKKALKEAGIEVESFNAALLLEPWRVKNQQGKPFRVFTPFWKHCAGLLDAAPPAPNGVPDQLQAPHYGGKSLSINDLQLLPTINWDSGFYTAWTPGEDGAHQRLDDALEAIDHYNDGRDLPAKDGTSRLSPHLHFGEISPRQIWAAILQQPPTAAADKHRLGYLRQLGWREFAHHLLFHFPQTAEQPLNEKFARFPWWLASDGGNPHTADLLRAWQRGETGIALVDAGMRQLWQTGWMHNRTRMVVASLLTKNLGIHWLEGARWFWDTLVDADLANNSMGWQWTAGSGADAAPFFRIFNPDTQAERFDADGRYRENWLGKGWRDRQAIVDLKATRERALAAYQQLNSD